MHRREIPLLLGFALWAAPAFAYSPPPAINGCVGSAAVSSFRLTAQPPAQATPAWISIRNVNNLPSGYRISYAPLDLPSNTKDAKLTLVMVPKAGDGQLTVLEPRLAASSTEWAAPFAPRIVLVVFAPQGLDEKRLTNLVTRDENLTNALADYADETAELESGLALAREMEQDADDDAARPARPLTPAEQAIFALVRALNPAVSSYDPLGAGRKMGAATLTGKGRDAFFENAGGLFPGAGALPMVKQWLLPDTEFRSVYAVPSGPDGMALCAQLAPKTRNKLAYVWAYRVSGAPAPSASIANHADLPIAMRSAVDVRIDKVADLATDFRLLEHAFDWMLVPASGPAVHIPVRPQSDARALRVDLRNFPAGPGEYSLQAHWDWGVMKVAGSVRLHKLDELTAARLSLESQDKLITESGPVDVDFTGADFLFVDRAALHRPGSAHQIELDLPQDRSGNLRVEIDTDALHAGPYSLALWRIDGKTAEVPLRVLPPNPRVDRIAPRVNAGEREQTISIWGSELDRISAIESDRAEIALAPPTEDGTHREAKVRLQSSAKAGDRLALAAKVEGLANPLKLGIALQVAAARPKITEAKASIPRDLVIVPREGEIPAGSFVSFLMKVSGGVNSTMGLECSDPAMTVAPLKLRPNASGDSLFVSFDPGAVGASGCTLNATAEIEAIGKSDPFTLGKVVRLPRIESFTMSDEKSPDGFFGVLKGFDLETIEKTGWDARAGIAVSELPRPIAGEGAKQSLRISMPWPSPTPRAPIYIWLRGETEGRATRIGHE
jgi:hypothetical protein